MAIRPVVIFASETMSSRSVASEGSSAVAFGAASGSLAAEISSPVQCSVLPAHDAQEGTVHVTLLIFSRRFRSEISSRSTSVRGVEKTTSPWSVSSISWPVMLPRRERCRQGVLVLLERQRVVQAQRAPGQSQALAAVA